MGWEGVTVIGGIEVLFFASMDTSGQKQILVHDETAKGWTGKEAFFHHR
jgi:hypothetical protein